MIVELPDLIFWPVRSSYRAVLGLLAAVVLTLVACGDTTGPSKELQLTVSPDTVRIDAAAGTVHVRYTIRNSSNEDVLTVFRVTVQGELPGGMWTSIEDADPTQYIQDVLGMGIEPGDTQYGFSNPRIDPGRYRLRTTFERPSAPGAPPAPRHEVFSNVFVVLAP